MKGPIFALLAAGLFGASTPFAKLLVGEINPWLLAGLLYLGSAIGLGAVISMRYFSGKSLRKIPKPDYLWLGLATLFGGIFGPVLLMQGLIFTPASNASLLLNLEGVLTSTLAWFAFKEHYDRRIVVGMIFIVVGGIVLTLPSGQFVLDGLKGSLFILAACLSWGLDNNFTRKVSTSDAVTLTFVKSSIAGITNCGLALIIGARIPAFREISPALILGFFGYGLSIVLFVLALRHLGASRTGAYFSTAPFMGAVISLVLFPASFSWNLAIAGVFMGIGVWLHLTENHGHVHTHTRLEHSHPHSHDDHHQHVHLSSIEVIDGHSHKHVHEPMTHSHPHFPDIHHQHEHQKPSS